ncbi:MAG: hypothetical protein ACFCBW_06975 [Candidatus Competibacterales bacterium]
MYALFDVFLAICLFRKAPQDLPPSASLLNAALAGHVFVALVVLLVLGNSWLSAALQALFSVALLMGFILGVLALFGRRERWLQTLTASAGAGAILWLVALPVALWLVQLDPSTRGDSVPSLLWKLLVVWDITVTGHILHHALSVDRWLGILYAFGWFLALSATLQLVLAAV